MKTLRIALLFLLALSASAIAQEKKDYATLWRTMSRVEKDALLIGARSGLLVPIVLLQNMKDAAIAQGEQRAAQSAEDAIALLIDGIFSADGVMMSLEEMARLIDLFYLEEAKRYEPLPSAVFFALVVAAR